MDVIFIDKKAREREGGKAYDTLRIIILCMPEKLRNYPLTFSATNYTQLLFGAYKMWGELPYIGGLSITLLSGCRVPF